MQSQWKKVGSYPYTMYFNGSDNQLTLQFFENTGEMFIMFSKPSEELAKALDRDSCKEMAANGKDIKNICIHPRHMGSAAHTSLFIREILKHYAFDDITKKEIRDTVNLFQNMEHYKNKYSLFAVRPLSSLKEEEIQSAVSAMPRSKAWV